MMTLKKMAAAIALMTIAASAANATSVYSYDTIASGASPAGDAPWMTATFENTDGGVYLTLDLSLDGANEFIKDVVFNIDGSANPCGGPGRKTAACTSISLDSTSDPASNMQFHWEIAQDGIPGGPDGLKFDMGTHEPGTDNFSGDYWYKFLLTGYSEDDFDAAVGGWYTRAHVQGIGSCSGWIGDNSGYDNSGTGSDNITDYSCDPQEVPVPGTLGLFGLGLTALGVVRRKR